MRVTDTSDLWWKTAVFYNLDVETYLDWNDDGVGDLEGLAHRLDHLAELGVTCLWLAPFYPSPQQDNGYDISDYYGVDPRYGHLGDFVEVVRTANDRGMRVIVDLVVNHTSDQHPWFQAARSDPSSRFRDYYQWRDDVPDDQPENMFPDVEDGVWSFDEAAGQYYRHSFYSHQPDLATDRQEVRDEIAKVIGFWLQLGIDGFRVDAVPHLIDTDEGAEHGFLQALRGYVSRRSGNGMMLGEVNLPYDEMVPFFGADDGDELTMQFDFVANQALYLSRPAGRHPARDGPGRTTGVGARQPVGQLRAQSRRADPRPAERRRTRRGVRGVRAARVAADPRSRHRSSSAADARRRPATHPHGLQPHVLHPGAPVLFYGEEIGMGENPAVSGRGAVRTPMQWTDETGGGFSRADADDLVAPLADEGWAPEHVNVSRQRHEPDSMLRFVQDLIRHYRSSPEIGWGELTLLASGHDCVLAHAVVSSTGTLVAVHNFAPDGRSVDLDLSGLLGAAAGDGGDAGADAPRLVDLLAERSTPEAPADDGHHRIELEGYGFRWLRVLRADEKRLV
nr:alpha-amylase family protein [Microbacterium flavescens]